MITDDHTLPPPTCGWMATDEQYGCLVAPPCGKPASWVSCVPFARTLTCVEHKCRCAKPIWQPQTPEPASAGALCPRCGGDGVQLTEVNLSGECRCGTCLGSGRVPDDGSASPWVNERLAERGLLKPRALGR